MQSEHELIAPRRRLVEIGMGAVFFACVVFAVLRLAIELTTGKSTPWWSNALGAVVLACLHLWHRRAPEVRSTLAVHVTATVAAVALLVPSFYGMPSSKWWLSLVGFAVLLMGSRKEALIWSVLTAVLIPTVAIVEVHLTHPNAIGEPMAERAAAPFFFVVILFGITLAFRRAAARRAVVLRETAQSLERSNRVRNRFLAHMSHEIRTPLHGVIAMTDLALAEALPPPAKSHVESALESAQVLLLLLNNLLDVTRLEADAVRLVRAQFDLHEALREVLRPMAARAEAKGLTFSARADPSLVSQRCGDRGRLAQLVLNLVSNALKFTERGGVEVSVDAGSDEGRIRIVVSDTGRGIASEDQERIFLPFNQVSSDDTRFDTGAGVGLAIARACAQLMEGEVALESEVGRGSTFTAEVALPQVQGATAHGPEDLLAGPGPAPSSVRATRSALRILVCEDEPMNRRAVVRMLELLGHECVVARDGEEGWARVREERFDVMISDIEMPRLDGMGLIGRIRQWEHETGRRRLPIVAATAHVADGEQHRLLEAGADAYLPKPFTAGQLEHGLRSVCGRPP